jgi:hypothetical protein
MTLTDYYSKDLMDVPGIDLDAAAITITAYVTQE